MTELSYQLYSSREFPPLSQTLKMLADIGYNQVEGYGGVFEDLSALELGLKANNLSMLTGHFGIDMLEDEPEFALEIAAATGIKAIYCPFLIPDNRPNDAAGWRALGARLQKVAIPFQDEGLTFGWHNHDFEFVPCADGSVPMDAIFEGGPDLSWEADIAWIARAGADPLDWISRYGDRISAVHIKDIAPQGECLDEDGWADVGDGTMDWNALLRALEKTPVQYYVMEHDKPNDHNRFAQRSFEAVTKMMKS